MVIKSYCDATELSALQQLDKEGKETVKSTLLQEMERVGKLLKLK